MPPSIDALFRAGALDARLPVRCVVGGGPRDGDREPEDGDQAPVAQHKAS